jgi:lipid A 3-O-deacylase
MRETFNGNPTPRRIRSVVFALLSGALVLSAAWHPAAAGTGIYDMSGLIDEPHPFASDPYVSQPQPFSQPVRPALPVRPASPARVSAPQAAQATAAALPPVPREDPSFLTLAGGYFDINDNEGAGELRIEWKGRKRFWAIKPILGVMGTTDGSVYGYGGIGWDLYFGRRIVATPSFAVGGYHDGNGKDLGSVIEFRSALELAYRFDNDMRLGLMFYHLSNAGIDDNNPGTEVLSLGLSVPLR